MVHLICPRDFSAVFDPYTETAVEVYEYVEEEATCIYEFEMESALACPIQCLTNASHTEVDDEQAFTVCSQKGICAADPEAGFVRCLCDEGWTGPNCNTKDTATPTEAPTSIPTEVPNADGGGGDGMNTDDGIRAKVSRLAVVIAVLV